METPGEHPDPLPLPTADLQEANAQESTCRQPACMDDALAAVMDIAFSLDSSPLASGCREGTISIGALAESKAQRKEQLVQDVRLVARLQ